MNTMLLLKLKTLLSIFLIKSNYNFIYIVAFSPIIFFLLNSLNTYCHCSDWEQTWIQGANLDKQPAWLRDNSSEDLRSLYEQMNGPAWRSIRDYYDVDNNNSKYLGYGWNQPTTQSNSPTFTANNFEYVVDNSTENDKTEPKTVLLNNARDFSLAIENLPHTHKVTLLREYLYKEIVQNMHDKGCTSDNNYMNLKDIVYETIGNEILMQLWSVSLGQNNPVENAIANDIVAMGYSDLNNPKISDKTKQVLAHILTQINLTNITRGQNIPMDVFLNNDESYILLLHKTLSYRHSCINLNSE